MIQIQDIKSVLIEEIVNLLLDEKVQPFEVYVPKSTQLFASTYRNIADDYAMLAFAGYKLNEVADEFSYSYISPANHDSVLFELKANNIEQLAETLLYISYGYGNEPQDEEVSYLDDVYDFIEEVSKGRIMPVCSDFIEDCLKYNKCADNELDSDE